MQFRIEIRPLLYTNMNLNLLSAKYRPLCIGLNISMSYDDVTKEKKTSALLALCAVTGEFRSQREVTRSFDVFFDLRLNKRLSKQSWGWWFETPSHPLLRHYYDTRIWYDKKDKPAGMHIELQYGKLRPFSWVGWGWGSLFPSNSRNTHIARP